MNDEPEVQTTEAVTPANTAEASTASTSGGEAVSQGEPMEVHPPHAAAHSV